MTWDELQERATFAIYDAIDAGNRRILFTAPTGFGKTRIAQNLILKFLDMGEGAVLYTNRRALVHQISAVMEEARINHGVRCAGYEEAHEAPLQIASIQTEGSRALKRKRHDLHKAKLVLIDEAHIQTGEVAEAIVKEHIEDGAYVVGITATPLGLNGLYDTLVIGAAVGECLKAGALVPVVHFAPDEPDWKGFRKQQKAMRKALTEGKDLTEGQCAQAMGPKPELFGRIYDNFTRLNADRRPTICFGPDIEGSLFLAEQFTAKGIRSAHLDGDHIWLDGELHDTTDTLRQEVLSESKSGKIVILTNRFVLREGIDCPWLSHGILATVFGSLQTYIQSLGRLMRSYPGLDHVTVQDHGGNWWRHGSANADREWRLEFTSEMVFDMRAGRIRDGEEKEPFLCPQCGRVWVSGDRCNPARGGCGFQLTAKKKSRRVVTTDGELRIIEDSLFPSRRIMRDSKGPALWEEMYFRARSKKWDATFKEAIGLFAHEHHFWPDPAWPLYPQERLDLYRKVANVPTDRLNPRKA